jgi:hypothetical protein
MSFISSFLSGVYRYFYPIDEKESNNKMTSSSFNLFLGPKAQDDLPGYVASQYPDRNYKFSPLSSPFEKEIVMEVLPDRFLVEDSSAGKPHASGFEPGIIVLMRSSNTLGVARIQRTADSFKDALEAMRKLSDKEIELFIVDGKASDVRLHEQVCRFVQCFNRAHKNKVATISDDLFQAFDFPLSSLPHKPGVQFAGFDKSNSPVAVIDYI